MAYGQWGADEPEWLGSFKDAAGKIAGDERAPMVWRARFAVRAVLPSMVILIAAVAYAGRA
jgi:hypothetical protein